MPKKNSITLVTFQRSEVDKVLAELETKQPEVLNDDGFITAFATRLDALSGIGYPDDEILKAFVEAKIATREELLPLFEKWRRQRARAKSQDRRAGESQTKDVRSKKTKKDEPEGG